MKYDLSHVCAISRKRLSLFLAEKAFVERKERVASYSNALILPGPPGGVAVNGQMVESSMVHSFWCPKKFWRIPTSFSTSDEEVVFLGCFEKCWGHCLTDNLKHLWLIISPLLCKFKNFRMVYVCEDAYVELPKNFMQMLAALGVRAERITRVCKPTLYRRVYVPDPSFFSIEDTKHRYYTDSFSRTVKTIISRIEKGHKPRGRRRIYLSRALWKSGNPDFGEQRIEEAFKKKGFEILRPENLTFAELVSTMQNCTCLAVTEGSCAHNSIFLPQGAELIILRKADYVNEYQPVINEMRDLNVTYVDAHKTTFLESKRCPWAGPFFVYCNKNLAAFLGVKPHFPVSDWSKYFATWIKLKISHFFLRAVRFIARRMQFRQLRRDDNRV